MKWPPSQTPLHWITWPPQQSPINLLVPSRWHHRACAHLDVNRWPGLRRFVVTRRIMHWQTEAKNTAKMNGWRQFIVWLDLLFIICFVFCYCAAKLVFYCALLLLQRSSFLWLTYCVVESEAIVRHMLSWWTKNSSHIINIFDIVTQVVPLYSVYESTIIWT